ncbi:MAG: anti-sigma factor [Acidobacteriaceae bacterium]|nr:anti-sigma factor [Acidobacteriaceae bacterium]
MSCEEMRGFIDAYVDGELDVVTALQFDRHLTECVGCRALREQYRELHDAVQAHIPYFKASAELENKIRAGLRPAKRDQPRTVQRGWFPGWRGWAIAASLLLLLAFGAVLFQMLRRPSASEMLAEQVVSNHIRSLMANHLSDVVSSDQHTVKPWFSGKLDFAPTVKDLATQGFPLAGGRLDYLSNRSVAALVYKRRQHTINLFVWPSPDPDSGPKASTIKGYNLVHWTQSHMAYWAISDLNAAELNQFVQDLKR